MKFVSLLALLVVCLGQSVRGDEATLQLARYLPQGYNTISVLRLHQMMSSPKGSREGWSARLEQEMSSGTGDLPPWLDTLVVGSLTHPNVPQEVWAAGVMQRPADVTLESIAARYDARVEILADRPAIQTNRGSYLVDFPDNILGGYRPGQRQLVAQWIRAIASQVESPIAPYLKEALQTPGHLVLSIHTQDMLDPVHVEQRLREDERFRSQTALIERLVPLLSGLRGVTLSATVGERTECEISIDFSSDVGPSSAIVKTLFLAMLEDAGAMIDEFPGTRISTSGQRVRLSCELSDESLRRLVSLVVPPRAPHDYSVEIQQPPASEPVKSEPTPEELAAQQLRANRRYLESANRIVNDLYRASQNATNYSRTITWHETFARKLEALPTASVDPALVDYAHRTAQRFRTLASSLRGQGIRVDTQNQAITREIVEFNPGWVSANYWGGFGYQPSSLRIQSNMQQVREKQAAAVTEGRLERSKIWDQILADQAEAQRLLSPR
ncbi:MAG: hypothetical protein KDA76_01010 [Planctomycetaceae bacterium]|nr:hypothetical protein [Planctomycetaceae bacterium]